MFRVWLYIGQDDVLGYRVFWIERCIGLQSILDWTMYWVWLYIGQDDVWGYRVFWTGRCIGLQSILDWTMYWVWLYILDKTIYGVIECIWMAGILDLTENWTRRYWAQWIIEMYRSVKRTWGCIVWTVGAVVLDLTMDSLVQCNWPLVGLQSVL